MHRLNRPVLLLVAVVALAAAGAATAGVVAHARSSARTLRVTAREYKIILSAKHLAPGAATVVVHNAGKLAHRIEMKGPGVKKLTPMLAPGRSATLHVKLKVGTYAIWCTVPGHAALGMKNSLAVKRAASGGAPAPTPPPATTTTPASTGGDSAWG